MEFVGLVLLLVACAAGLGAVLIGERWLRARVVARRHGRVRRSAAGTAVRHHCGDVS